MFYSHTQSGWRILVLVGLMTLGVGLAATCSHEAAGRSSFYVLLGIFLLTAVMFHSLTIEVGPNTLSLWFGPGFPRKTISLSDIQECRMVRNPWYYGWGIHRTPRGWLYNISGFDAVELDLKTGKRIRIGTDEPDALCSAIRTAIQMSIGR